jgi:GNAT superfamily N-acetyltransferase
MALAAVRSARPTDVDEIVRIQAVTWRTAYAEFLPAAALDELTSPAARQAWLQAVEAGGGHHVLVATEGEWTVGFAAAAGGEVSTLLVEPRWGRRGHGGRLLHAAAEALRSDGAERGVTWVAEADHATQRFYARAGWEPDGAVRLLDAGGRELRELRLAGTLELRLRDWLPG